MIICKMICVIQDIPSSHYFHNDLSNYGLSYVLKISTL